MITFEKGCEIALARFQEEDSDVAGLCSALEVDGGWVFNEDYGDDIIRFGPQPLIVDMRTGECKTFMLNYMENMEEFDSGKELEIPEKFRARKR